MCFFPFSLALSIKSALFTSALVLALSGLGLFLAKVALYNSAHFRAIQDHSIKGGCAAVQVYWALDFHPLFGTEVADDHLCHICDALWEFREI